MHNNRFNVKSSKLLFCGLCLWLFGHFLTFVIDIFFLKKTVNFYWFLSLMPFILFALYDLLSNFCFKAVINNKNLYYRKPFKKRTIPFEKIERIYYAPSAYLFYTDLIIVVKVKGSIKPKKIRLIGLKNAQLFKNEFYELKERRSTVKKLINALKKINALGFKKSV